MLLLRAESLFVAAPDSISAEARVAWPHFLRIMATTAAANAEANPLPNGGTPLTLLGADVRQPLHNHFERFADVASGPLRIVCSGL